MTLLEVQPFSQKQIQAFVDNWYLANEIMSSQKLDEGVKMEATVAPRTCWSGSTRRRRSPPWPLIRCC